MQSKQWTLFYTFWQEKKVLASVHISPARKKYFAGKAIFYGEEHLKRDQFPKDNQLL